MAFKDNLKIIREFRGKKKAEIAKYLGIGRQNLTNWENGSNEPGSDILDKLSNCLQVPRELLYKKDLTKEYLEKNFSGENLTPMPKADDNNGKPNPDEVWSQVEKSEKYTVVPTIILDKYEILSNREIESRETTLQEVRATMKIAIAAKDQVISFLEAEIEDLRARLKQIPPTQDAQ